MAVTPGTFLACWMLLPWVPIARPMRSSLTVNSSWNAEASCFVLYKQRFSHFNPGLILSEPHTSHINNQENQSERADLPPDVWWPPRSGTWAGVWCECCVNACHLAGRRAWRWLRSWTVLGNIMLIKILSCLNLLTEVPRLTGTHQYSQFTLLRDVNNTNGSDCFFEILVSLFVLTSNMGKEEMSAWFQPKLMQTIELL